MDYSAILAIALLMGLAAALYSTVGHGGASAYLAIMALFSVAPETMRPTALALNLIVAGVGRTPAALAGILLLIQPVAGALIAWPLFGETLTLVQIAGAALVLAGVWLAGRR